MQLPQPKPMTSGGQDVFQANSEQTTSLYLLWEDHSIGQESPDSSSKNKKTKITPPPPDIPTKRRSSCISILFGPLREFSCQTLQWGVLCIPQNLGPRSTVSFLYLWVPQRSNPSNQTPPHKGRAWPWVKELQGIEATYVLVYICQSTKCKIWALVVFILLQSPLVLPIFYIRFCNCNLIALKFYT